MNLILKSVFVFLVLGLAAIASAQKKVIIRLDDMGMCHAVNTGAEMIFQSEIPVSVSLMAPCPWFNEAVTILKKYPHVSIGVHLTLNAEWQQYKWGPVLGRTAVPSLIDSTGFFPHKVTWFYKDIFTIEDMEKELRAQIEKVINSGLQIDYLDSHMGACMQSEEQIALMKKLAAEYHLVISGSFEEKGFKGVDSYIGKKVKEDFLASFSGIENNMYLIVNHPGMDTEEMRSLSQEPGKGIALSRYNVSQVLSSKEFKKTIAKNQIELITYKQLKKNE